MKCFRGLNQECLPFLIILRFIFSSLSSSIVHPREVFKEAIKHSANSIILVHNHPSGSVEPSDEDYRVNKVLVEAGELVGIKVLDHLIVGGGRWKNI